MKKLRRKPKISTVISMIFLILCSVIFIYPLFYLLFYSLTPNTEIFLTNPFGFPHDIQWVNYSNAIKAFDILAYFGDCSKTILGRPASLSFNFFLSITKALIV